MRTAGFQIGSIRTAAPEVAALGAKAPAPRDQPLSVRTTGVAPSGRRVPTAPLHGLDASFVGFWWIMALFENLGMPEPDV
jgi:hypothetical protein